MSSEKSVIGNLVERVMDMDDEMWARHTNPWCGWSRIAVLPLLAIVIWGRIWWGWWALPLTVVVLLWGWLNPRVFSPPSSTDPWMSRGILGLRLWVERENTPIPEEHARVAGYLSIALGVGVLVMLAGVLALSAGWTIAGLVASVGAVLWFLDRMVWLKADSDRTPSEAAETAEAAA